MSAILDQLPADQVQIDDANPNFKEAHLDGPSSLPLVRLAEETIASIQTIIYHSKFESTGQQNIQGD